jgi:hypothetical protein
MNAAENAGRPETAAARRRDIERHCVGRERVQAAPQPFKLAASFMPVPARPA